MTATSLLPIHREDTNKKKTRSEQALIVLPTALRTIVDKLS